ncbi:MAG: Hsp70 family protein [Planctomycetes bacterium]|nr:Hsp70 family protein [Planctomycetota bacterium]
MSENDKGIGFGLDFGTTNSVVALHDRGHVRPITDSGFPHPSVVWNRPEGQVTVGRSARDRFHEYSNVTGHRFATSVKSHLGTDYPIDIFGSRRTPAQVARDILAFLRQHAMDREGLEIREAVFTIPVSFGGQERADLRRAAQDAGIFVKTFVHEPFAAVVAHFCATVGAENLQDLEGQNILVFDWGGGCCVARPGS